MKKLSDIIAHHGEVMIVVAFASQLPDVMDKVKQLYHDYPLVIPDMPVVGDDLFTPSYYRTHYNDLCAAYELMADDVSRQTFVDTINYKISGDPHYLFKMETHKDEIFHNVLCLGQEESYVDLGAYRGDTISELLSYTQGSYKNISAMEPDSKTFTKLEKYCENMTQVALYNTAAWDSDTTLLFDKRSGRNSKLSSGGKVEISAKTLDSVAGEQCISYIKMDIEGAEREGLIGAQDTIARWTPKLNIAGYHRNEDLFAIPLQINEMNNKYKIFFRHHPYFPAWDNNFYCING